MNTPYKACRDDRLLTKLEDLNTAYIHLDGVDDYGWLEITITSCEDADDKIRANINSHGLEMDEMNLGSFSMKASTLRQLMTMSAAYAAGAAAMKQFYESMIHDNTTAGTEP